jgi:hypothetical protein
MTKKINELSREELQKVYDNNNKLQYAVYEDFEESQMFWVSEMLEYLKDSLKSWSIGFNNRDQHIRVKDFEKFVYCVEDLQKDTGFLPDDKAHVIEDAKKAIQEYDAKQNDDIERDMSEWDKIESDYEEMQEEFTDEILSQFNKCCDYKQSDIEDYFFEFYSNERMDEDYYIDDDFILYEHISYEKCYK